MNWLSNLISRIIATLTGGNKTPDPAPTSKPTAEPIHPSTNAGACSARIVSVYTGVKADPYAAGTDPISIGRKGVIYYNMSVEKIETVDVSIEINGKPIEINERHDTSYPIETGIKHTGRTFALQFPSPDPNGYPIGTWENTEMILRDHRGNIVDRYAFCLIVTPPV